jgi:hypothetical protein
LKIDASRRRNDPRKQSNALRSWCGLEISPSNKAYFDMLNVERGSSEGHNVGSEISRRRVWGQKPGQLGNIHHRKY